MPNNELTDAVVYQVEDNESEESVLMSVSDSDVIRVNIDSTLSISGEAADAYAVGQALAGKLSASDLRAELSIAGRTAPAGSWAIPVNGDNIPAKSDSDSESIAEALERLDGVDDSLEQDIADEVAARGLADDGLAADIAAEAQTRSNADTALNTRVAILESRVGLYLDVTNITYSGLIGQTHTVEDSRITANWFLARVQFYTGATVTDADATGEILADLIVETGAGFVDVTVGTDYVSGCSCRILLMSAGWAGGA